MENVNDKNRKLIKALELIGDYELMKPIDEIDGDLIDATVDWSLRLQNKDITLSTEEIEKMVSMIPFDDDTEELETNGEAFESRKVLKKNKVLFIAAVITILVTLLTIISVAFEWNIFEELKNRFGSVADTPVNEEILLNDETVIMFGEFKKYETVQDFLTHKKMKILYPYILPDGIVLERVVFYQEQGIDRLSFEFNDENLMSEIILDKGKKFDIKNEFVEICKIKNITCYILDMSDVEYTQIYFEYDGYWYMFMYTDKQELMRIIENLKELE